IVAEGSVTPEMVAKWLERKLLEPFEIEGEEILALPDQSMTYKMFLPRLFDLCGRTQGKQHVGSLTPAYVRRIGALHTVWPWAKFVHIIRDGREVCLSALSRTPPALEERSAVWAEARVSASALRWERDVRLGQESGRELGQELYHEVRYEALIAQPEQECDKLCAFLDVPYEPEMLRIHTERNEADPAMDAKI